MMDRDEYLYGFGLGSIRKLKKNNAKEVNPVK
jgi:hypothetical protein